MSARRSSLLVEFAAGTSALRTAAQAGELAEVARLLATRQRLIDEARRLDADAVPLTLRERRALEAAAVDEAAATEALGRQRGEIMNAFKALANSRRAHAGYSPAVPSAPGSSSRRA